ncbi:mechanosensitive ion channel family protein [Nitratireductor sp. StC3]|uniref:mechanosensitive ion channel family protein n=1 Tax=Nitratireductor sp. StC3 TaxID=2126741 RepID=UPI0018ED41D9|nr:mechanosensitive ion channel family protein [Nitratireductor sp. StC3]
MKNQSLFGPFVQKLRLLRPILFVLSVLVLQALLHAGAALAQAPQAQPRDGAALEAFLEAARKDGSTVIVVQPGGDDKQAAAPPMTMAFSNKNLLEARANMRRMIANAMVFLDDLPKSLKAASPDGTAWWLVIALVTAVGGLIAGHYMFRLVTRWGRDHFRALYDENEQKRSGKLAYLLARAGWMLLSAGIMFATAILVAVIFDTGHEPTRATIFIVVSTYIGYRVLRGVVFWNFFAPTSPAHRLVELDDAQAQRVFRHWAVALAIGALIIGLCRWIQILALKDGPSGASMDIVNADAHSLAFIVGLLICAAMLALLAVVHKQDLRIIILGKGDPAQKPAWLKTIAFLAVPLLLLYLALAWFVSSVRLTLGLPGGYIPVLAPIIVFVAAIFAYAVASYLIEIVYERRAAAHLRREEMKLQAEKQAWERAQAADEMMSEMSEDMRDMIEEGGEMTVMRTTPEPSTAIRPYFPAFKPFFENVVQATILVVSAGELARLWGIDIGREGGHPLAAALDILLAVIVAASAYRTVNGYIDHRIVEEGGTLDDQPSNPGEGDSEGGKGQSRLATLLPIFRNVLISAIIAIGAMVVLANLGVDIGPLFAGAGVIGIAIGFGAQTLIRDIFSGAFFLIDDAFRKGEYIEIDNVKGVVEKISMRSFQLRHHLGAVHTVPFGEIHQLTNYSRDWVMMKLPLRLTYDTDVEKVRKLIKKLGQQLLEDEVVGPLFLQPLKSQGVYKMEDSAMIVRVKFMTRPGDQFVTRKVVYAAIRDLFEKEGVRFAHREVTVRLADGEKASELSPAQKEAIAGSVRSAIDEEDTGDKSAGKSTTPAL